jgi:hypothetical protein
VIEFLQWVVWLPIWVVFSVVIHEAGHAIGGRLVGLRVPICGVGIQKPLFSFSLGATRCFFGLWPINGLTLLCCDSQNLPIRPMVIAVAVGPLTNLLVGLISLSIDLALPGTQPALAILTTLSFVLTLNLLPIRSKGTGFSFRTDGMMILRMLRRGQQQSLDVGAKLRNHEFLCELGQQVKSPLAQNSHDLAIAVELLNSIGARDLAEERFNRVIERQKNAPENQQLPVLTQFVGGQLGRPEIQDPPEVESAKSRLLELASPEEFALELEASLEITEPANRVWLLSWACTRLELSSPDFPRFSGELRILLATATARIDDSELRDRFLKRWLEPVAAAALGDSAKWPALAPDPEPLTEAASPDWAGKLSLFIWILSLFLHPLTNEGSADSEWFVVLILLLAGLGLFLGGLGLGRPGHHHKKAAFVGSLGNGLQAASHGWRLLALFASA